LAVTFERARMSCENNVKFFISVAFQKKVVLFCRKIHRKNSKPSTSRILFYNPQIFIKTSKTINRTHTSGVGVRPNPAYNNVVFEIPSTFSSGVWDIIDLMGRNILSGSSALQNNIISVELSKTIPNGFYCFVYRDQSGGVITAPFVIKH